MENAGSYELGALDQTRLIFVKDMTTAPDATKPGPDGPARRTHGQHHRIQ